MDRHAATAQVFVGAAWPRPGRPDVQSLHTEFLLLGDAGTLQGHLALDRSPLPRSADAVGAGASVWLIERRRIEPVMRALERTADPLFRQAGIDLDT
jgi:hypothetical protein